MTKLPSSRSALRRLLLVLAVVVGIALYAYGWNTTDISLDEVQDDTRQESVQRAMRELLSPDIFDRDREQRSYMVTYPIGCPAGDELPEGRAQVEDGEAYVIFDPPCARPDDIINIRGYDFPVGAIARIQLFREGGQNMPFMLAGAAETAEDVSDEAVFDIDGSGTFNVNVKVPRGRGLMGETHPVQIQAAVPSGMPRLSSTSELVIDLMGETLFLALMATSLALPASIVLSFLSARNLMRQISMPLGNVLVGFVLLPVGGLLGALALGPVGELGVRLGKDLWPGFGGLIVFVGGFTVTSRFLNGTTLQGSFHRLPSIINNILLLLVIVFTVGVLGGIGIWLGGQLFDVTDDVENADSLDLSGDGGEIVN
ncbi:MAG: hypothetical protein EHM39_13395, partial [Chloroflexi bacterium]